MQNFGAGRWRERIAVMGAGKYLIQLRTQLQRRRQWSLQYYASRLALPVSPQFKHSHKVTYNSGNMSYQDKISFKVRVGERWNGHVVDVQKAPTSMKSIR